MNYLHSNEFKDICLNMLDAGITLQSRRKALQYGDTLALSEFFRDSLHMYNRQKKVLILLWIIFEKISFQYKYRILAHNHAAAVGKNILENLCLGLFCHKKHTISHNSLKLMHSSEMVPYKTRVCGYFATKTHY